MWRYLAGTAMQRRSASLRTAWKSPQQSSRSGRTLCRCCSSSSVSYILSKAPWQQPATATFISAAPPLRRRRAAPSTSPPTARAPARWWGWAGAVRATAVSGRPLRPSPSRRQTATRGAPHAAAAAKRGWASRGRSKITAVSSARGGAAALYASLLSTRGGESRQRQAGPAQRLRFALGRKTVTAVSTAVRNKSKRPVSRTQSGVSRTCGAFRSGAGGPCRGYASCLTLLSSPPPPPPRYRNHRALLPAARARRVWPTPPLPASQGSGKSFPCFSPTWQQSGGGALAVHAFA